MIQQKTATTYSFKTGYYGLTDMPAEFQKAMDYTLIGLQHTYCFLDEITIVSAGTETDHLAYIIKCLKKLDEDKLKLNLQQRHFAKTEIEWLDISLPIPVYHHYKVKQQQF